MAIPEASRGELNVVTGALGYTGRYIASALFERGARVRTLTAHRWQPTCPTAFSSWLRDNANLVGRGYTSELAKRFGGSDGRG